MRKALILSVVDQAALSAFNFLLALLLIRYWSDQPEIFGTYAVVMAGSLTLVSVQNALVISHMTVLRPKASGKLAEEMLLSMFWSTNVLVTLGATVVAFIGTSGALGGGDPGLGLAAALFVGSTLIREYTRCYHFSSLAVGAVLALDAASLAISVIGIAAAWYFGPPLTLGALFLILAGAQMVVSLPAIWPHRGHFRLRLDQSCRDDYRAVWREQSRWALLSVIATEFQQRGYVFVVALVFGTAYVGLLQAAALLFRPVQLLTQSWGKLARVILADHFAHRRFKAARAFSLQSLAAMALIFFVFLGALAAGWPLVQAYVFKTQFANLETVVILWSVATGIGIVSGIFSVEAQSLIKFRELCYAAVLSAVACGVVLALAVGFGGFRDAIYAVIAGQLVFLFLLQRIISRSDRAVRLEGTGAGAAVLAINSVEGGGSGSSR